ncbi:MAG: pseudouridylate synthase [Dysgonamonadaceae bacterium]|jgi:predicted hotdog family 3-hydroxylacyl-ACP dehydratase|nr:pseudouridylate synthase [Dysgonamonadaceae bacterium]
MTDFEIIDIQELLPQRPPFVMVDKLLYCDPQTTRTAFTVKEDNLFCDNGVLSEAGIAENIAQTCAARIGYINKCVYRNAIKIGFIGAIRNQEFLRLPLINETLVTQIKTIQEVFQTTLVDATVHVGNELITSCEMKIAITDIDEK